MYATFTCLILLAIGYVQCSPRCTGNPRTYNGKPCASTTHYTDGHKGACGCGWSGGDSPFQWMTHGFTTAPNQMFFDSNRKGWCGGNCGRCVKLTTTGGYVDGEGGPTGAGRSVTFMVTNLCPVNGNEKWCGQRSTSSGNTFGYMAHFDLEDTARQVTGGLGWNNPEVTFEFADCNAEHGHDGRTPSMGQYNQCQCAHQGKK